MPVCDVVLVAVGVPGLIVMVMRRAFRVVGIVVVAVGGLAGVEVEVRMVPVSGRGMEV